MNDATPSADLAALELRLSHTFTQPALLLEALTHPSYLNEHPATGPHNQRLEFLGDAVLQLILTDALFALYPTEDEGALTKRRSLLVQGTCLARLAAQLGLNHALRLGGSENTPIGRNRLTSLEDAFEALIGALYLDAGLETTRALVLHYYGPLTDYITQTLPQENPKGRLLERAHALPGQPELRYETLQSGGFDHAKEYTAHVYLGERKLGTGTGFAKKAAEEAAARMALAAEW
jgi:ribonuclease III